MADEAKLGANGWTFSQVPIWLVCDGEVSDGAKTLFAYLKWRQGTDAGCWPSVPRMAADLGVSEDTVRRRLHTLKDAGYLSITERRGHSNYYELVADPNEASGKFAARQAATPGKNARGTPGKVAGATPGKNARHDESHEDESLKDENTQPPMAVEGADAPDGNGLPHNFAGWQDFIRDAKGKKGGRPAALRLMFTKLYPNRDPPAFAYLGKVAKRLGEGRLAELLWQHSTRPPTGDVLAYVQAAAKGGRKGQGCSEPAGFDGLRRYAARHGLDVSGSVLDPAGRTDD